jgi:hypothetical protein
MADIGGLEQQDIEMFSGDDKSLAVTVYAEDGITPVDITGFTVTWILSARPTGSVAIVTKTVGSGITLTDPGNGVFTVTLADTDTDALLGKYYHQARITDQSGNKSTVLFGLVDIFEDRA